MLRRNYGNVISKMLTLRTVKEKVKYGKSNA